MQLQMRFLPKSRSHDSDGGSVASDAGGGGGGSASSAAASGGTARARIARCGARQTHSQSSPTHRGAAADAPAAEWRHEDAGDDDEDEDVDVEVDVQQQQQQQQQSRLLVSFDDADLKDTRV